MQPIDIEATIKPAEDTLAAARSAGKRQRRGAGKPGLGTIQRWFAVRDAAGQPIATLSVKGALGVAELGNLWVAEPARGKGIARRLVEAAEAEARGARMARLLVRAYEFESPDFFRHLGYRPLAALRPAEDAAGICWLAKPLSDSAAAQEAPPEPPAKAAPAKAKTPGKFARTRRRR